MTDRELRLRQRIDKLTLERDRALALSEKRRQRARSLYLRTRELEASRNHWKRIAGARVKKRLESVA